MRADMLPYAYCTELAKMLDQAPAFPSDQAIAIIERNLESLWPMCSRPSTPSPLEPHRWLAYIRRS